MVAPQHGGGWREAQLPTRGFFPRPPSQLEKERLQNADASRGPIIEKQPPPGCRDGNRAAR